MKKLACMLLVCVAAVSVAGCTKGNHVKKTTLYVEDNGEVTSAIVEPLDKDYYDITELEKWIKDEVKSYNQENDKDAVTVKKCEEEDKNAKVTLLFASMEDYSSFNRVEAFQGSIDEGVKAGYQYDGELKSTKGKPSITFEELKGSKDYYMIVTEESQTIVLDHEILYVSDNVKVDGEQAVIDKKTDEPAYIIYKQ